MLCCLGGGKTDLPVLGPGGGVGTMNFIKHNAVIHHFVGTHDHTYLDCPLPL